MVLESDRLFLREPAEADVELLRDYHRRNEARFAPWDPLWPDDPDVHHGWIAAQKKERRPEGPVSFLAIERASGDLAGIVMLNGFNAQPPGAMVNYTVDGAYEGKGYASEALRAVTAYAFDVLGLESLSAYYHPDNARSERLLERTGFQVVLRGPVIPGFEQIMRPQNLAVLVRRTVRSS